MFIDQDKLIYKDFLLSNQDTFIEEYELARDFGAKALEPLAKGRPADYKMWLDLHNGKWDLSGFLHKDVWFKDYPCKRTMGLVKKLDHTFMAAYSLVKPGCVIYPHVGYDLDEPVYRVHLPLIVPKDFESCWIKVGEATRSWKMDELLIFDDTMEHEVQNNTNEDRVVLLIDFYAGAFTGGV